MSVTHKRRALALIKTMRLPFLALTPACLFLGYVTARAANPDVALADVVLIVLGAGCAHVSVNMLNEYFDFRSGLDALTVRTPFSGGSGGLLEDPSAAVSVLVGGLIALGITLVVGGYFVATKGALLLPLGSLGVAILVTYTTWLNHHPLLCLVAPGIAFGPIYVLGTHFVLAEAFSASALCASLVVFFVTSNLLLVNQIPDVAADRQVGRRHLPIAYGARTSGMVFCALAAGALLVAVCGVIEDLLPGLAVVAMVFVVAQLATSLRFLQTLNSQRADSTEQLLPFMALNVAAAIGTPLLLGVSFILG